MGTGAPSPNPKAPSAARAILLRIAAISVAVVGTIAFLEAMLRIAGLASGASVATMRADEFTRLPGVFSPNQHLVDRSIAALSHTISIDSLGYRGTSFPRAKAPGEFRILFTGDSFTFGGYVDDSLTVPVLLEQALATSCPGARVINGGLGGSTITEQEQIVRRSLVLRPDLVLLMFYDNDVSDLTGISMWDRLAANRVAKSRFPASVVYPLVRRSAILGLIQRVRVRLRQRSFDASMSAQPMETSEALRHQYLMHLSGLRDTLLAHSIPLVFAAMPSHLVVEGASDEQLQWIVRSADSLGLPTTELLGPFRRDGREMTTLFLLPHDGHASPAGNRLIAGTIAGSLEAMPFVRDHCATP